MHYNACEIFKERLILVISILSCNWFSPCRQLSSLFVLVPSELSGFRVMYLSHCVAVVVVVARTHTPTDSRKEDGIKL